MFDLDDPHWKGLKGGYRIPFDPRPEILKLKANSDTKAAWHTLWENLHHQGDVGEASYAAVPHLVRIYRQSGVIDWNTYAIVAIIELARENSKNPEVPDWLEEDYFHAIRELALHGVGEVLHARDREEVRAMLSVVALAKGARTHARFIMNYSDEELLEIERQASKGDS